MLHNAFAELNVRSDLVADLEHAGVESRVRARQTDRKYPLRTRAVIWMAAAAAPWAALYLVWHYIV